jgi:hypothetical protein
MFVALRKDRLESLSHAATENILRKSYDTRIPTLSLTRERAG